MDPEVTDDAFQRIVAKIAVAAVQLQRLVGDVEAGVGGEALGHGAILGGPGVLVVQRVRGSAHHQPGCVQVGRHIGQPPLQPLELGQDAAELPARGQVALGRIQRQPRPA